MAFDPIERSKNVETAVCRRVGSEVLRKYYRFRPSRFYGGSAVADAVGCNLRCAFCWGWRINARPESTGFFCSPSEVAEKLVSIARRHSFRVVRISGGEPTLCFDHLEEVLDHLERLRGAEVFILETNGLLIGWDRSLAKRLSRFDKLLVRVSIKACSPRTFEEVTGASERFWRLQLEALRNLLDEGVAARPALMTSFCSDDELLDLVAKLREIDPYLPTHLETEYVILYPSVADRLKRLGLEPRIAVDPRSWSLVRGFGSRR